MDETTLYTMRQAAQVKGVNYHTVSRAVRRGTLPARRLGRQVLITAADLTAWQPMYARAPHKYRRAPDPTAAAVDVPAALLERAELERQVKDLTVAVRAAAGELSLVDLQTLCDGLAALVAALPDGQRRHDE